MNAPPSITPHYAADGTTIEQLDVTVPRQGSGSDRLLLKIGKCFYHEDRRDELYNITSITTNSGQNIPINSPRMQQYTITFTPKNGGSNFPVNIWSTNTTSLDQWFPCPEVAGGKRRTRRHKRKAKKARKSRSNSSRR